METPDVLTGGGTVHYEEMFKPALSVDAEALAAMFEVDEVGKVNLPKQFVPGGSSRVAKNQQQRKFLRMELVEEVLYGGAAGGGKSDALLMAALQYVHVPGYAAILFRRTYADLSLPGALMERAQQWLANTPARWNDTKKTWTFPSGATLTFGYLATANDKFRYQSAEFQFIGFDEVTQFPETDYTYLFSRLRKPEEGPLSRVPLRMRGASNPGGTGHRWVKERFIDPWETGTETAQRKFVPAKLADNPHVHHESYRKSLANLDVYTRQQLEEGDWNARMPGPYTFNSHGLDAAFDLGDMFDLARRKGVMAPPVGGLLPLGIDFGESTHVLLGWPLEQGGMYIVHEYTYHRGEPDTQAEEFCDEVLSLYCPPHQLGRQRFDSSKPESMRLWARGMQSMMASGTFGSAERARPSKVNFNQYKRQSILHMRKMLEQTQKWLGVYTHPKDKSKNVHEAGQAAYIPSRLAFSRANCPVFHTQIYELQFKDDDTEDIVKENDHGPDAAITLCSPLSGKAAV